MEAEYLVATTMQHAIYLKQALRGGSGLISDCGVMFSRKYIDVQDGIWIFL